MGPFAWKGRQDKRPVFVCEGRENVFSVCFIWRIAIVLASTFVFALSVTATTSMENNVMQARFQASPVADEALEDDTHTVTAGPLVLKHATESE